MFPGRAFSARVHIVAKAKNKRKRGDLRQYDGSLPSRGQQRDAFVQSASEAKGSA